MRKRRIVSSVLVKPTANHDAPDFSFRVVVDDRRAAEEKELRPGRHVLMGKESWIDPVVLEIKRDGENYSFTAEDSRYEPGKMKREKSGVYIFDLRFLDPSLGDPVPDSRMTCTGKFRESGEFLGVFAQVELNSMSAGFGNFILFPLDKKPSLR